MMKNINIAYMSMLAVLAIIFGYIESLLPIAPLPGVKLGISNIVILVALLSLPPSGAFLVMLIKVFVSCLLFSGFTVLPYSLAGGILSFLAMYISKKLNFSIVGISMTGGVFHNLGQLFSAMVMLGSSSVMYYLPLLLVSGLILGIVTGIVCRIVVMRIYQIGNKIDS